MDEVVGTGPECGSPASRKIQLLGSEHVSFSLTCPLPPRAHHPILKIDEIASFATMGVRYLGHCLVFLPFLPHCHSWEYFHFCVLSGRTPARLLQSVEECSPARSELRRVLSAQVVVLFTISSNSLCR